ncbi:hypothetical protein RvY_17805 [Ramazzottius varieornatus]|uniref:EF-hand domain-containing protein n=1 Tax=Ramazzottius varieornatus TaxID=947166 RepID=A0A1D1W962_RAMVA|nr:hypothetical protein RvY_17805 [Ramazzottius varieornatus]
MGNEPSSEKLDSSMKKQAPAPPPVPPRPRTVASGPFSNGNTNPEAPPAYDDIFGPSPSSTPRSSIQSNSVSHSSSTQFAGNAFPTSTSQQFTAQSPVSNGPWNTAPAPQNFPPHAPNWQKQQEKEELRMWFSAVDENNDGYITTVELQHALLNDNWTPFNMDTIKMMLKMFDRNFNDRIEFDEFAGLKRYVQEWKKIFDQYDDDRSGTIDVTELQKAFQGMSFTFSLDFCSALCRRFSTSSPNQINLDAFIYASAMVTAISKDHARAARDGTTLETFLQRWLASGSK